MSEIQDYKKITKNLYEKYAKEYENNLTKEFEKLLEGDRDLFLKNLKGKKILDVGSGPGRDSIYFKKQGYEPLCIDFSEKMIELCKKKGLEVSIMNFENMNFPDNSFDGVWAYTSLLHIPKSKIKDVLRRIYEILKPNGMFFLGMTEGFFEGMEEDNKYRGEKKFKALYEKEELRELLVEYFIIIQVSDIELPEKDYINILCKVKKR